MVRASWVSCGLVSVSSAIGSTVDSLESGSILQTTRLGSMNLAMVDAEPVASFIAKVEGFQATADALTDNFGPCRAQTANEDLLKAAQDDHVQCRVEQLAMASLNPGKDCEDSKKEDCDHMQSLHEKAVCASDQSCQECAARVFSEGIAELKLKESANQRLYVLVHGEHPCEIREINTDVNCDDAQPEQPLPNVTYPSMPNVPCASPSTLPGGEGWSIEEYQGQNWSQLVADVSPCPSRPSFWKLADSGKNCVETCGGECDLVMMKKFTAQRISNKSLVDKAWADVAGFAAGQCKQESGHWKSGFTQGLPGIYRAGSGQTGAWTECRTHTDLVGQESNTDCESRNTYHLDSFRRMCACPPGSSPEVMKFIGEGWCENANSKSFNYAQMLAPRTEEAKSLDSCKDHCLAVPDCVGINSLPTNDNGWCHLFLEKGTLATADMMPGGTDAWFVASPHTGYTHTDGSGPVTQLRPGTNAANAGKCFAKIK